MLAGVVFLKKGYHLGRAGKTNRLSALVFPALGAALLLLLLFRPSFLLFSAKGPGSLHAPLFVSIGIGLAVGFIAQKTRMCFAGGWRDIFLVRDFHLFSGIAAFFAGALAINYLSGLFAAGTYHWGFDNQPVAHADHLWNFLPMALVGLSATLLGGCPLRQMVLASEGDADAGVTFLGLLAGAAFAHNFLLASSPKGPSAFGPAAIIIGLVFCILVGLAMIDRGTE